MCLHVSRLDIQLHLAHRDEKVRWRFRERFGDFRWLFLTFLSFSPKVASRDSKCLEESCRVSLSALQCHGSRTGMVIMDETVWCANYELVCGLRPESNLCYIGGFVERAREQDFSCIPKTVIDLPPENLSKLSVHYAVTCVDDNAHMYCVDLVPRGPRDPNNAGSSDTSARAPLTLDEMGAVLKAMTQANTGIPPAGGSWDGGGANSWVNAAFLGLLPDENLAKAPFFSECSKKKGLKIPLWCYKPLFYKGAFFMSGNNDSRHVMKRMSAHLVSGTRVVRWGSFLVNLTPMIRGGLPIRALAVEDVQSDKDMAKRLNSGYLKAEDWSSYGCLIAHFVSALVSCGWSGSRGFTLRESLSNVLLGYYLLLIQASQSAKLHGKKWPQHFLPVQCLRSLLDLVGHYVQASRFWDPDVPWVPSSREENRIEGFFGQIKSHARGSPTLKDCLYGLHNVHARQLQKGHTLGGMQDECQQPVTDEELHMIAVEALQNACEFPSWISVDASSSEIKKDVEAWWEEAGQALVKRRFSKALDAEAELEDADFDDYCLDMEDVGGEVDALDQCPTSQPEDLLPEEVLGILEDRQELMRQIEMVMPQEPEPAAPAPEPVPEPVPNAKAMVEAKAAPTCSKCEAWGRLPDSEARHFCGHQGTCGLRSLLLLWQDQQH